ncbi:MAG: hypothetical protein ABW007_19110 [Chitinophagaceae bacterium]
MKEQDACKVRIAADFFVRMMKVSRCDAVKGAEKMEETIADIFAVLIYLFTSNLRYIEFKDHPIVSYPVSSFCDEKTMMEIKDMLVDAGYDVDFKNGNMRIGVQTALADSMGKELKQK